MGPERGTPVTSRRAPHRRYAPVDRDPRVKVTQPARGWGLYPGEPEACRRQLLPFLQPMAQLGLLLAIFKRYQIEGRAFLCRGHPVLSALPVHYLAPYRWKKPLFVAVSIGGLFWVFGPTATAIVLGLSALLIGVCFLPISWAARARACLAALCAILALARSQAPLGCDSLHRLADRGNDVHVSHDDLSL